MRPILSVAAALLMTACASTAPPTAPPRAGGATPLPSPSLAEQGTASAAVANLASASGSLVSGRVELAAVPGGVRITGEVGGLVRNGAHSLQVHERGDCSAADAASAGPYFDPQAGAEQVGVVGGNRDRIVADAEGVARVDLLVARAVLGGGAANDIAGRALVVLGATPGAFSARVACGAIAITR
ncbi:superoxide dismutase family protein [Luteimonas sp. SJ-92]|uniref:Superoxide dismutase family protein n=1 Tax=Luteimonas salinisoli TaxID=2752307 RepID=A0A853JAB4_9GAMM|nr:superoxide dismutase family protein [Luteimonas salinisoli]NZA26123.1 superoxide dismutase family protein [Luteimonas salinisoli]